MTGGSVEAEIRADVRARVDGYVQAIRDVDIPYMEGFWADVDGFTVVLSAEESWMYVFHRFENAWKVVHSAGAHIYS